MCDNRLYTSYISSVLAYHGIVWRWLCFRSWCNPNGWTATAISKVSMMSASTATTTAAIVATIVIIGISIASTTAAAIVSVHPTNTGTTKKQTSKNTTLSLLLLFWHFARLKRMIPSLLRPSRLWPCSPHTQVLMEVPKVASSRKRNRRPIKRAKSLRVP